MKIIPDGSAKDSFTNVNFAAKAVKLSFAEASLLEAEEDFPVVVSKYVHL